MEQPHSHPLADELFGDPLFAADVALLGRMHESVLEESGAGDVLVAAQDLLARLARAGSDDAQLGDATEHLSTSELEQVARSLTVHLHLVNLAEERHRIRGFRSGGGPSAWPALQGGSVDPETFRRLHLHPVLTAHPTEARRRAVASALRRIADQLDRYDDPLRGAAEREVALRRIREEIEMLRRTAYLRTTRPEPNDEVRTVMTVFDETLVPRGAAALPVRRAGRRVRRPRDRRAGRRAVRALRQLDRRRPGRQPLRHRRGHPGDAGIHAEHVLRGCSTSSVERVGRTLTLDVDLDATEPRAARRAGERWRWPTRRQPRRSDVGSPEEPHRQMLLQVARRVEATRRGELDLAYRSPDDLLADLRMVQESLDARQVPVRAAYGELQHLVWQVQTFGFHLAELEVRQHSDVHKAALAELLAQVAGVDDPAAAAQDAELLDRLAVEGWPVARGADQREDPGGARHAAGDGLAAAALGAGAAAGVTSSASASRPTTWSRSGRWPGWRVGDRPLKLDVVPLFETGEDLARRDQVLDGWMGAVEHPGLARRRGPGTSR